MPEWFVKRILAICNFAFAVSLASLLWVEYGLKLVSVAVMVIGVFLLALIISDSD